MLKSSDTAEEKTVTVFSMSLINLIVKKPDDEAESDDEDMDVQLLTADPKRYTIKSGIVIAVNDIL